MPTLLPFDISCLMAAPEPVTAGTITGIQYGLCDQHVITVNGDQEWIRDGRGTEETGKAAYHRSVTITYGPWTRVQTPADRAIQILDLIDSGSPLTDELYAILREWRDQS